MRTMSTWLERDGRDSADTAIPTGSRRAMLRTLLGGAGGIALAVGAAATVEADHVFASGWQRCTQCRGLVRGPGDFPCPAGGVHRLDTATTYALAFGFVGGEEPPPNHETGWRRCTACGLLIYQGGGSCAATEGEHTPSASEAIYHVEYNQPPESDEQTGWRYCPKCEALFRPKRRKRGACHAGGKHEVYPDYKYNLYLSS